GFLVESEAPGRLWGLLKGADTAKVEAKGEKPKKDGKIDAAELGGFLTVPKKTDYGFWSLIPAIVALGLAFATKQVLPALFLGVVSGAVVAFCHSWNVSDLNFLSRYFLPRLGTGNFAFILLVYLWFLGGILGVWAKTGGPVYFAERVGSKIAKSANGSKIFAWLIGCIFHQGGTVSTVLAGTTVKPVSDKHKVSHEELAYIVDSTASPVATIIPFNAWPAYIGGLVAGLTLGDYTIVADGEAGAGWFYSSIPFNFYGMFALLSTFLFSLGWLPWTGKRMKAAIKRSRETGKLDDDSATPMIDSDDQAGAYEGYKVGLEDFFVPICVLLGGAIIPFFTIGYLAIGEAFIACTLSAMVVAGLKGMPLKEVLDGFLDGCKSMTLGAIILGLAVTLGGVSQDLRAADFLINAVSGWMPAAALPAALTVICMVVAFSIGSSFGTYAVIFPIAVPLALKLALGALGLGEAESVAALAESDPEKWASALFYVQICFGAVMGGAVFGDQCSPISDTTILSSMFTGCDLLDHVRTQLPLALAAAFAGMICSTVLALSTL
ncbi:MAG: Na+/H+ antiporter NhaC family protein, partial [Planctomycetota bacterium]